MMHKVLDTQAGVLHPTRHITGHFRDESFQVFHDIRTLKGTVRSKLSLGFFIKVYIFVTCLSQVARL